jgi:hypothetical protein
MNMSLVISSIIGGLLMLAMIGLNSRVSQNSGIKTLQFATKSKVDAVASYVTADLRQVGAGVMSGNKIEQVTQNRLTFRRTRVDGVTETVQWRWVPDEGIADSPNVRDRRLFRVVGTDTTDFGTGIVSFQFRFLEEDGDSTLTISEIRSIRTRVIVESDVSFQDEWARSYWESTVTPRGIQN